jgi:hypothetical protein
MEPIPMPARHSSASLASVSRRQFLAASAAASVGAAALAVPPAVHTAPKTDQPVILGEGDYRYQAQHAWPRLPSEYTWQTTHNVAVDRANNLYVIHEGRENLPDHPAIFVFGPEGKFIRAFGKEFQGGGHGIEVRQEGNEEFLYVCAYQQVKAFAKLTLKGETVWLKHAPMESQKYAAKEDTHPQKVWGRDRFLPTNFAFLADGGFFLADGYGSFYIHRFDPNAKWVSCFGGEGKGEGTFNTPHGICIDNRKGREPAIVICDRANHTLQFFDLAGKYRETVTGFGLPANLDTFGELLLVPELHARLTLLNGKNEVVAHLGEDVRRITTEQGVREDAAKWNPGKFVHPHDACFDAEGNIFVAEWVASGRVTKLTRLES